MINKNKKIISKRHIKSALLISLIACSTIGSVSCKKKPANPLIDDSIAIVYENKIPYLINKDLDKHSLEEYDSIEDRFSTYISICKDGKYGFIDKTGKLVIEPIYDKVFPMNEDKAVVIKNGVRLIINNKGETLYTFDESIISESTFNDDFLVVSKKDNEDNDIFGYLKYDNGEFIEPTIFFDYASKFKNGYGIVGKYEVIYDKDVDTGEIISKRKTENLKYNFFSTDSKLLFDDFKFDYADTFYDGYARVANYENYQIDLMRSYKADPWGKVDRYGLMYSYIDENGEYLKDKKGIPYKYPYAKNFHDNIAIMAKYIYNKKTKLDVKEFIIINTEGRMNYINAIYDATQFHIIKEQENPYKSHEYMTQVPGQFWMGDFTEYGDYYLFRNGNTHQGSSWKIEMAYYDYENKQNSFNEVKWSILNDDGTMPDWMIDYNDLYLNGTTNPTLASNSVKTTYEMDEIHSSMYYTESPITKIRMSRSNKYGLVGFKDSINTDDDDISFVAYFVLVPIYDKIIY